MRALPPDRVRRRLLRGGALVALGSAVPLAACGAGTQGHLGGDQDTARLPVFLQGGAV